MEARPYEWIRCIILLMICSDINTSMEVIMKANGPMMCRRVRVRSTFQIKSITKDNLREGKNMETDSTNIKMATHTKVLGRMT